MRLGTIFTPEEISKTKTETEKLFFMPHDI
jgi:hypothetical protein